MRAEGKQQLPPRALTSTTKDANPMIEADRVLSTPPTNTSATLEVNPPPEARAESVDSFSHQSAIGQPGSGKRTSESPKPPEGFHTVVDVKGRVWFKADDTSPMERLDL